MDSSSTVIPESLIPYLTGQLTDYSSLKDSVIRCNIVFIVLIVVSSAMRMFVRLRLLSAAGLDDLLMVFAVLFALVLCSTSLAATHYGLGIHIWNLSTDLLDIPDMASRLVKLMFVCSIAYSSAITFTKCAIIASYLRIFPHKNLRRLLFVVGFVVISFWIASIFAIVFACSPVQAAWDFTIPNAKCFPIVTFFYVYAGFNIATDIILCVAPMPLLWAMNLPTRQKCIVCVLFGIGLFACVASILRLTQLYELGAADLSYESASSLKWSTAEVGTAILCASLSSLRPLASRIFPSFFSHFTRNPATDTYTRASVVSEVKVTKSDSQSALHTVPYGGIHVRHSYEVSEMNILPQEAHTVRKGINNTYNVPFDESDEQLVKETGS